MAKTKLNDKADLEYLLMHQIGAKLPKKVRKKLRWKKVVPILSVIITAIIQLLDTLKGDARSGRIPKPRPTQTEPVKPAKPKPVSPEQYGNQTLRGYVEQAMAYQAEINRLAQTGPHPGGQNRVGELAAHVKGWTEAIIALVRRIDAFQQNKLINQDLILLNKLGIF